MGVTTWLVILACFCVIQESFGSVQERRKSLTIVKMLRRLAKKRDLVVGPMPSPNPIDFYQHWVECPVLESILEQYFRDFPNATFPKDSMNISPDEMRPVMTRVVTTFDYLKNVRVAMDLLIEDTARLVLDKRVNCTTTMYQRVFVYYMRRRLDQMMSPRDTSLKSRIEVILSQYFSNNSTILGYAGQLLGEIHYVVHESFIHDLQEEEFKSLGRFLRDYKWSIPSFLERYHQDNFAFLNDWASQMVNDFFSFGANYTDAFRCTTPQEFINMHTRVANRTVNNYWQAHKSGQAVSFLTRRFQELFNMPHAPSHVKLDPVLVDEVVQKLVNVILGYVNDTVVELATYEGYLASATLSPPTFMASSLSDVQWNTTMMLFNRMFPNSPLPPTQNPIGTVSPGPGMSFEEIAVYISKDVENLHRITVLMPTTWASDQEYTTIQNELYIMITEKKKFLDSLPIDKDNGFVVGN
ncbi:uncharacterized protein LOC110449645 isoform X3 [Mizuhopecten yessoensis]|uniref:uncharacterized protein LOC110449645 isoform X3 n=1 Tax=Mizuhopecten yessoensis TaxID=6573 RepID=UPI000B45C51F|nr:uncharacterized protein LOC110449645 isoform X3 [Mizuhopecten yessoensis]